MSWLYLYSMVLHPVSSVSRSPVGDELAFVVWVDGVVGVLTLTVEDKLAVVAVIVGAVVAADKVTASTLTVDFCTVQEQ